MNVELWRWSAAVQASSDVLIALFFVVLARSTRRAELHVWISAWLANLCALAITLLYWLMPSQSESLLLAARLPYIFFKTLFLALMLVGAFRFRHAPLSNGKLAQIGLAVLSLSIVLSLPITSIDILGVISTVTIVLALGGGAVVMTVKRLPATGWLAAGFALRAALAVLECAAYSARLSGSAQVDRLAVDTFLAMSSSFDAGAEWMIVLGCALALYGTIQLEMTRINSDLRATKEELRALSHRDPLTGVFNRRRLTDIMNESRLTGATILFFDLNDFKDINDVHGHHVGDEALRHFAKALQASFRPSDHVVRYAGDEFIVIGQGIELVDVSDRIANVRDSLLRDRGDGPPIDFEVGTAYMPAGGDPDAAIRAADAAMYRRKGEVRREA
jgi:diguanylate cyclase (GGDEF)-like protein